LFQLDRDPIWLDAAMRGADWLILKRDAGKKIQDLPHDHWLLIALNELQELTSSKLYVRHSLRIADSILMKLRTSPSPPDWIGSFYDPPRSTPTATRAEGLIAVYHLTARNRLPNDRYLQALKLMAQFQLRCQIKSKDAHTLPRPDLALGGFRRGLTDWEVRIDYVQHNLSSLLGLYAILTTPNSRIPSSSRR
jgi:hypothetical protein